MPLVPEAGISEQERQAIGALMADIGASFGTSYTAGGSGARILESTIASVFKYSQVFLTPGSDGAESQGILANLDAALPVLLSISRTVNSHLAVCDGYGYNGGTLYHHINLGWGGSKDAWYNLPNIDTGSYQYNSINEFYYNIYTNGTGEIISGRVLGMSGEPIPAARVCALGNTVDQSVNTDGRGIFAFHHLPSNTQFRISASCDGLYFPALTVTTGKSSSWGNTGNRWGIILNGEAPGRLRTITGTMTNVIGRGMPDISLVFSGGAGMTTTDSNGAFSQLVPFGWSGTATPSYAHCFFEPPVRTFSSITTNLAGQNFKVCPNYNLALNADGWRWLITGDNIWLVQNTDTHDDLLAARSGPLFDNQQASIETTLIGPGTISFWWRVSSEKNWDKFYFFLDTTEQASISGEISWEQRTYIIPKGSHTVRWIYAKDSSGTCGQDAAWLDQVCFNDPARLFGATLATGHFRLSILTETNKSYALEYKNALTDSQWLSRPDVSGNGLIQVLTDPAPLPCRFYRVRQQ
jgi:hypothetical protein